MYSHVAYCEGCGRVTEQVSSSSDSLTCLVCNRIAKFDYFNNLMDREQFCMLLQDLEYNRIINRSGTKYIVPVYDVRVNKIHSVTFHGSLGEVKLSTTNENRSHRYSLYQRCEHFLRTNSILENN